MTTVHERRHESARGRAIGDVLKVLPLDDTPLVRDVLTSLYERGYQAAMSAKSQRKRRSVATGKELVYESVG